MGTVTSILEHKEHLTGDAVCLQCKHEWIAVAEIGTVVLECPECELSKGVFGAALLPESYYVCHCGCASFYISAISGLAQCAFCGVDEEEGDRV